jgi:hypothetical protein
MMAASAISADTLLPQPLNLDLYDVLLTNPGG